MVIQGVAAAHYPSLSPMQRRLIRAEYVEAQEGKCLHCDRPLSGPPAMHVQRKRLDMRRFPQNFLLHPVHLHHNHKTGMTIGAVHAHCNGVLWQYHGE